MIHLISLASPCLTEDCVSRYRAAINILESKGYKLNYAEDVFSLDSLSLGRRLTLLIQALESDDNVILNTRGGYGSMHLLPYLDTDLLKRAKDKVILGYSDLTALALFFAKLRQNGIDTPSFYHAPMLNDLVNLNTALSTKEDFWHLLSTLMQPEPVKKNISLSLAESLKLEGFSLLDRGQELLIYGGNLAIICAILGTPYFPKIDFDILLLEEVNEPPYKCERMIYQLLYAGCFDGIEELWLGKSEKAQLPVNLLKKIALEKGFNIRFNLPIGHSQPNFFCKLV